MGKPRLPNKRKEYKELSKRLAGYMMQVRVIYDRLNEMAASIVDSVGYDGSVEFSFADYPETKRDLQLLQRQFVDDMQSLIYSGTSAEWKKSNLLQDLVANKALKYYRAQVAGKKFKHYYQTNSDQLKAFQRRTERGLNLSAKLWNQSQVYKDSLEATISTAIEKGMSAVTLSKRISKYLNDWPSLQADYQEKFGKATNCYDCEYRSIRLARNEINIAYRTAEQLRWQQFDFILGYKIKLSGSHPAKDICDDLAGDYPKDFKFVGWHPNCYLPNALVLTDKGWKYIKDVSDNDKVLSLKPETRELEYVGIVARQSFQYQGEIVRFRNRSLDCSVTQDHRMVYLNKSDSRIKYKAASDFNKNMGGFYRGCEYQAEDIGSIDINGEVIQFDLFCEFMGYWLSDGSLMHNHQIVISQQKGEPAYDGILRCISGLGHKPYVCKDVIVFNDSKLNSYLKQFGTCNNKFIPKEITCSSTRQISIFLNAFVKCDGHTRKPKSFVGSHGNVFKGVNEEREFFTTSERLYAGLCELLLKIGKRPSVSVRTPSVTTKRDGSIIKGNYDLYIIRECNSVTATFFSKTTERYDGMVYDLTLERNHIMYIQQNGKCYWGSNCLCYTVPIVMSEEEYWSDDRENSPNMIVSPPDNFNKWVYDNSQRIHKAESRGTLPYWIRDNHVDKVALLHGDKKDVYKTINWGILLRSFENNDIKLIINSNKKITDLLDKRIPPIRHTDQAVIPVNGSEFKAAISAEKTRNKRGWMVDVHEDYSEMKCFLTSDGKAGIAVTKDGDIISVFSSVSGDSRLEKLIPMAIGNGGVKCDCYGGGLQNIYARFGGEAVGKTPFNKEYAPEGWDGVSEFPVVAMIFPKSVREVANIYNKRNVIDLEKVKTFKNYEKMLLYRDKKIKQ